MAQSRETNTLAAIFDDDNQVVIMEAGSKNTDEAQGTLYNIPFPKSELTNLPGYKQFINNNWDGKRHGFAGLGTAEKIAKAAAYPGGYEASEPTAQTFLERAVQNILVRKNPTAVAGLSESQLISGMAPFVAQVLNDPARTESYRPLIEAEIAALKAWSAPRPRKGEGTKAEGNLAISLD